MDESEVENEEGFELPPLNFEAEYTKYDNISHQNGKMYQQVAQRNIKNAVTGCQGAPSFEKMDKTIVTLYEAAKVIDSIKLEVKQKQEKIETVETDVQDIGNKISLTAKSAQEFSVQAEKKELELKNRANAMNDKGDIVEEKRAKLTSELEKWKNILGLELVNSSHGGIIFVFTNIDRDDSGKKFSCEVGLSDRQYKVTQCFPMVPGLENMVELLNKTNDLSGFVVNLRRKFVSVK